MDLKLKKKILFHVIVKCKYNITDNWMSKKFPSLIILFRPSESFLNRYVHEVRKLYMCNKIHIISLLSIVINDMSCN